MLFCKMMTRSSTCDIDLLIQWEFQLFKYFSVYRDEEDFTTALNSLIPQQQFQLISKLMSNEGGFSSQEMVELFQLGDKFLIYGETKEKIFSLFIKQSLLDEINIRELLYLNLWNEFGSRLKRNWAIKIDECFIQLTGLKVGPKKKDESFVLLGNLAKSFNALFIYDIPLCSNDLEAIHSDLTKLHIERCPFNFEEQLDLSLLTRLTHFTCSNCFADCHLLFTLESITSDLKYLNISDNWLNPIDHSPLVNWIEKQKSLKNLNLSKNNLNIRSAPTLFNVLLNHPSLKILDFTNNYLGIQFLKQLSSFSGTLNWKSLTINDLNNWLEKSDLLSVCFSKLKQLEYLNMADNCLQDFSSFLCKGLSELTNLKEFVFNSYPIYECSSEIDIKIENLFKKNPDLEMTLNVHTIKSFQDWKLFNSNPKCELDELIKNQNIENVSQSIYRYIFLNLNSSNNNISQLENSLSKFRGVGGVKVTFFNMTKMFLMGDI